mgnify:FL=1
MHHPLYAVRDYQGEILQDTFGITFPYLKREHVRVWINGIPSRFTWLSDKTIKLDKQLQEQCIVRVRRRTPLNDRVVDFQSANLLTETDLDTSALQLFFIQQEMMDDVQLGLLGNPNFAPTDRFPDVGSILDLLDGWIGQEH